MSLVISDPGVCTDTDSSGGYRCFVSDGWDGVVTPMLARYTFVPQSRQFLNITSSLGDQDYIALDGNSATIWDDSAVPGALISGTTPWELGVKFQVGIDGVIAGLRFYKVSGDPGPHIGHLWSGDGTLLATVTFSGATAAGWQEQVFASPVPISADTTYVASYYTMSGRYTFDSGYFENGGVDNGPLRALADGEDGPNGVWGGGGEGVFPDQGAGASNFWVDVVFVVEEP